MGEQDLEAEVGVQRMVEDRKLSTDSDVNGAFLQMERRMLEDMLAAGGARYNPRLSVIYTELVFFFLWSRKDTCICDLQGTLVAMFPHTRNFTMSPVLKVSM
jgi:hypothetical protein